jgi:opacity protein-like surface antigen
VYNLNRWIGGVIDVGAVNNGRLNQTSVDTTVMDFVAGPRFTFHNHSRFLPYAQALFGGAYSTISTQVTVLPSTGTVFPPGVLVNPNEPLSARLTASNTGFAMLVGGGLDIKLSKRVAFRPFEASYYLTRIPSLLSGNVSNRNNFRYAAGINFLFGAK